MKRKVSAIAYLSAIHLANCTSPQESAQSPSLTAKRP
jgi:hypothetical protein